MLWTTFAPCCLWIFLFAPWMERAHASPMLSAAFAGVTAAVVGVILELALWISVHVLFMDARVVDFAGGRLTVPVWSSVHPVAVAIASLTAVLLAKGCWPMPAVLALCAAAGFAVRGW